MLGIQGASAGFRKAREASQKQGLAASDSECHRRLPRGGAVEGSSTRVPAIRRGPESDTDAVLHAAEASGALPRSGRLARPEPSCGVDRRVTFKNPNRGQGRAVFE
jgi:hypothetical protein